MPLSADSVAWIAVGLAVGAAVLALVFSFVVPLTLRRRRGSRGRPAETRDSALTRALAEAREETRRARELGEISASLDLDAVLSRTLDTAARLPGIDAAMIVLPKGDGRGEAGPLVGTAGMSADEAVRQPVGGPPDGQAARAVRIAYSYGREETEEEGEPIRGGFSVPLRSFSLAFSFSFSARSRSFGEETERRRTGNSRYSRSLQRALAHRSRTRAVSAKHGSSRISTR